MGKRKICSKCGDFNDNHSESHCITFLQMRMQVLQEELDEIGAATPGTNILVENKSLRLLLKKSNQVIKSQQKTIERLNKNIEKQKLIVKEFSSSNYLDYEKRIKKIVKLRDEFGLTHKQIAEEVGCTRETVSRYLSKLRPTVNKM